MITYILETLAFQLVFLLTYDLFLKKETFFQWNRLYLLATFGLSLVLPWVKVEALKSQMPEKLGTATVYLNQLDGLVLGPEGTEASFWSIMPWYFWVMAIGAAVAAFWFGQKLFQLARLRRQGIVDQYPEFTKVTIKESALAFSFFRNIFLGAEIRKDKEANIIAHELVHVRQHHSLDLLLFELARIVFWFNPLVYVYQNRMAELHEFIADAQAVKHNKKEHFEILLSEAFSTQRISFVNQFFTKSLIKKRIVMLQKKRSKAVWQLKYVLLLPLVLGMLVYTSCESEVPEPVKVSENETLEAKLTILNKEIESMDSLTPNERESIMKITQTLVKKINESPKKVNGWTITTGMNNPNVESIPFATIDEVPVFPGCENAEDKKACFNENIQNHIRKHFNYPQDAQEQGIQGRVGLVFHINENGDVMQIMAKGPSPILEAEAVRIINRLPKMTPGKQDGKPADVVFAIPITFKLK